MEFEIVIEELEDINPKHPFCGFDGDQTLIGM